MIHNKTILFVATFAAMLLWNGAQAQNDKQLLDSKKMADSVFKANNDFVYSDDPELVRDMNLWIRAPFMEQWYVGFQVGPQLFYGFEDRKGPFFGKNPIKDGRLTWDAQAVAGRWVYPQLGYRLSLGMGYCHGYLQKSTYEGDPTTPQGIGNGSAGIGGYYDYFTDDLYIQRWRYGNAIADIMVNLINTRTYNPKSPYNLTAYFGFGLYCGYSDRDNLFKGLFSSNSSYTSEGHLGFLYRHRYNKFWSWYADIKACLMDGIFDREWSARNEKVILNENLMVTAHVGIEYAFHKRWNKWYDANDPTARITSFAEGAPTVMHVSHSSTVREVTQTATIETYDTILGFSPAYDSLLNARAAELAALEKARLDSLYKNPNRSPDLGSKKTSLGDILQQHLLPYEMVFFALDRWEIRASEDLKIAKMAQIIKQYPDEKFLLIGAADAKTGSVKRNQFLSTNRSDVVYRRLIDHYDVDPEQLQRVYMGGILDFEPFELNRSTTIIMNHPKVMEEFNKLKAQKRAGGGTVQM